MGHPLVPVPTIEAQKPDLRWLCHAHQKAPADPRAGGSSDSYGPFSVHQEGSEARNSGPGAQKLLSYATGPGVDKESPSRLRQSHPGYQPRREQRGAANSKGSNCQYRFKNHGNTETLMHIRKARMCLSLQQSVPNSNAAKGG